MAQVPWIQNTSLRANILFGLPMDEDADHGTKDGFSIVFMEHDGRQFDMERLRISVVTL